MFVRRYGLIDSFDLGIQFSNSHLIFLQRFCVLDVFSLMAFQALPCFFIRGLLFFKILKLSAAIANSAFNVFRNVASRFQLPAALFERRYCLPRLFQPLPPFLVDS